MVFTAAFSPETTAPSPFDSWAPLWERPHIERAYPENSRIRATHTAITSAAANIAGLIILAAAPCTAMVFGWSNLTDGDPNFTLSQVALNDTVMVFALAPIVALLLGLSSITVPWMTLFLERARASLSRS